MFLALFGILEISLVGAYLLSADQIPSTFFEWVVALIALSIIPFFFSLFVVLGGALLSKFDNRTEEPSAERASIPVFIIPFLYIIWFMHFAFIGVIFPFFEVSEVGWVLIATSFYVAFVSRMSFLEKLQERFIYRMILARIPVLGGLIGFKDKLQDVYRARERRLLIYYYFYPLILLPSLIFSSHSRREFGAIFFPISLSLTAIVVSAIISYFQLYPPHLDLTDLSVIILAPTLFVLLILFFVTPPLTALTGDILVRPNKHLVGSLSVAGLIGMILGTVMYNEIALDGNFKAFVGMRNELRMAKGAFRDELANASQTFFLNHPCSETSQKQELPSIDKDLTLVYRESIAPLMGIDEAQRFSVIHLRSPSPDIPCMSVIFYKMQADYMDGERVDLDIESPENMAEDGGWPLMISTPESFYRRWRELPVSIQNMARFKEDGRYLFDGILVRGRAQYGLLEAAGTRKRYAGILIGPNGLFRKAMPPSNCPEDWFADDEQGRCVPPVKTP